MDAHIETLLIQTIVILLVVATGVSYVFHWLRLPTVLGFILTGVLIGPQALKLVENPDLINALAQIGIIFLLFIIGLELPISKIKQLRFHAPISGILQLGFTTLVITLLFRLTGMPLQLSFLLGSILSLSSTAIVLKNMEDIGEIDTVHGRLVLGILIIQDLSTVPLMTLVPTFSSPLSNDALGAILSVLFKALLFLAMAVTISLRIIPSLLDQLASSHRRELFTLSVVTIGLGTAFITGYLGLSYEAGAFIAGLSLSGNVYSRQVVLDSRPFREVFATLFFVSVGLLVDLAFLRQNLVMVLLVTFVLMFVKFWIAYGSVRFLKFPQKTSLWVGCALFQVGEFSFILLRRVLENAHHISSWKPFLEFWSPLLINAIILSMFVTPLMIRSFPKLLYRFSHGRISLEEEEHKLLKVIPLPPSPSQTLSERVLIAGYGPVAQHLVSGLKMSQIPFTIIEMNLNTVKKLHQENISCQFGDVSHPEILKSAGVEHAKILALTFPDIRAAELAIQHAKHLNPGIYCIVRAKYLADIEKLYALGADEVVHEEFETALSFIFNTFHAMEYPVESINHLIGLIREREQKSVRDFNLEEQPTFGRLSLLADTKIEWLELKPLSSLIGKKLSESSIREHTGVNVLAIASGKGQHEVNPDSEYVLQAHDVLVVLGNVEQLHKLEMMISSI